MTATGFAIQPAVAADADCLAALNACVHQRHLLERPEFFRATDARELSEWFRELLTKQTTRCWIAWVDTMAAGYVLMREHQRAATVFCRERHWHEIEQIGVEPSHRRQGIGQALIQTALAAAAATSASDVELASWSFNADAQAWFTRLGFRPRLARFDLRLDPLRCER
jgi:ribosomal protein S18 acetylase RimI-like enzyme